MGPRAFSGQTHGAGNRWLGAASAGTGLAVHHGSDVSATGHDATVRGISSSRLTVMTTGYSDGADVAHALAAWCLLKSPLGSCNVRPCR